MNRFICLHGHFYQPPRENPWLDAIERQPSASPHRDWNHRIAAECYAPNGAARILDAHGRIERIVNNYAGISFNFGPTLLSWLERHRPGVYRAILDADRRSRERFSGHGSAIAQVYNHIIMPLANRRDRATQVRWGVRDFEYRFGRRPEGIWLAETAVDVGTLEACAAEGIVFTILAPHQARRIRRGGRARAVGGEARADGEGGGDGARDAGWVDVTADTLDTRRAYRCALPSGREIALFFYDGAIARDLAFGQALENGERFADRLLDAFGPGAAGEGRLVHTAVDGETFGHHHPFGDMALAWCLRRIEESDRARLANYGEFLAAFPPEDTVEIVENTAWSCGHGVERWRADCGCRIAGPGGGTTQAWRGPLRAAMDALRDRLAAIYEERAAAIFPDPWGARDAYIEAVLDRSDESIGCFLAGQAGRSLPEAEGVEALRLLEMQRHAMLMYTSCGWFFDDIAGLEAVQVMRYAARAMRLALKTAGEDLEPAFRATLEAAPCNEAGYATGAAVWDAKVRPSRFGPSRVGAGFAVGTLFPEAVSGKRPSGSGPGESQEICGWRVETREMQRVEAGSARAVVGRALFRSNATRAVFPIRLAALHVGEPDVVGCVVAERGGEREAAVTTGAAGGGIVSVARAIGEALERGDRDAAVAAIDAGVGRHGSLIDRIPGDGRIAWFHRLIRRWGAAVDHEFGRACRELRAARVLAGGPGNGSEGTSAASPPLGVPGMSDGVDPFRLFRVAAALRLSDCLRARLGGGETDGPAIEGWIASLKAADPREIAMGAGAIGSAASRAVEAVVESVAHAGAGGGAGGATRDSRDGARSGGPPDPPDRGARLESLARLLWVLHALPVPLDLWRAQNIAFRIREDLLPDASERARGGEKEARRWVEAFGRMGRLLGLRIPETGDRAPGA